MAPGSIVDLVAALEVASKGGEESRLEIVSAGGKKLAAVLAPPPPKLPPPHFFSPGTLTASGGERLTDAQGAPVAPGSIADFAAALEVAPQGGEETMLEIISGFMGSCALLELPPSKEEGSHCQAHVWGDPSVQPMWFARIEQDDEVDSYGQYWLKPIAPATGQLLWQAIVTAHSLTPSAESPEEFPGEPTSVLRVRTSPANTDERPTFPEVEKLLGKDVNTDFILRQEGVMVRALAGKYFPHDLYEGLTGVSSTEALVQKARERAEGRSMSIETDPHNRGLRLVTLGARKCDELILLYGGRYCELPADFQAAQPGGGRGVSAELLLPAAVAGGEERPFPLPSSKHEVFSTDRVMWVRGAMNPPQAKRGKQKGKVLLLGSRASPASFINAPLASEQASARFEQTEGTGVITVRTNRALKAGEEITCAYGPHFTLPTGASGVVGGG